MIIRGGLCRDWVHRVEWTPEFLTKHIGKTFRKVKKQFNNSRFIYFDALPEFPLHPYSKAQFKMLKKIKSDTFWEIGLNESNNKYLYYSYLAPQSIVSKLAEIGPNPSVFFKSFDGNASSSSEIMLWIGFRGIMAAFHYDANINFFHQIKGSKQFHLIAPTYWHIMDVFPRLHPSDRQSQINFDDRIDPTSHRDLVSASKLDPNAFQRGTVKEGDMLYLPPFWFHEVVTISGSYSVSLNIWSASKALTVFQNRILSDALPYARKYRLSHQQLKDSLTGFIPKLAQYVMGKQRGKQLNCGTL